MSDSSAASALQQQMINPRWLSWPEADPSRHAFDPGDALAVVRSLPPAAVVSTRPSGSAADRDVIRWSREEGARWADAMSFALVERYGRWACGWRWSIGEADYDGGPVSAWCCPRDSMTTPDQTLVVVTESLLEWRRWLEDLAERFSRFLPLPADALDDVVVDTWERAVAHLVTVVVDRTNAESGWYGHCKQVLEWFLAAAAVPAARHEELIDSAIGGRFNSWITPPDMTIRDVAERFATDVARQGNA